MMSEIVLLVVGWFKSLAAVTRWLAWNATNISVGCVAAPLLGNTINTSMQITWQSHDLYSYSHFHKDGCVLFTNDDYLPPKEAEDVALPMVDLQELLEPACPRCDDVSNSTHTHTCTHTFSCLTETRKENGWQFDHVQEVLLQILLQV